MSGIRADAIENVVITDCRISNATVTGEEAERLLADYNGDPLDEIDKTEAEWDAAWAEAELPAEEVIEHALLLWAEPRSDADKLADIGALLLTRKMPR